MSTVTSRIDGQTSYLSSVAAGEEELLLFRFVAVGLSEEWSEWDNMRQNSSQLPAAPPLGSCKLSRSEMRDLFSCVVLWCCR